MSDIDNNEFEGAEVIGIAIKLTNAGDGLSAAMKIDPTTLHHGDRVRVLVDGVVNRVQFDPLAVGKGELDFGRVTRVQQIKAEAAMLVDEKVGAKLMREHKAQLDKLRGQPQLDGMTDAESEAAGDDDAEWESDTPPRPLTDDETSE